MQVSGHGQVLYLSCGDAKPFGSVADCYESHDRQSRNCEIACQCVCLPEPFASCFERSRRLRVNRAAAHVHVLGHRRAGVAELVCDETSRQCRLPRSGRSLSRGRGTTRRRDLGTSGMFPFGSAVSAVIVSTSPVLWLAVAPYLARSRLRLHTNSDLRGYLVLCQLRAVAIVPSSGRVRGCRYTCPLRRRRLARKRPCCAASLPRLPVDGLAEQVSVTVVAGVLLDHVHEDPPQGRPPLTVPGGMGCGECGFTGLEMCRHDAP